MKTKILSIILAFIIFIPTAFAETWITVSSWAYNDVSNFKKEGMLPDTLESIGDFTKSITRLQFAQILYSALTNVADTSLKNVSSFTAFADTDDISVNYLLSRHIITGEFSDDTDPTTIYFYPDRYLTREEMAVIIHRTIDWFLGDYFEDKIDEINYKKPSDFDDISDWAANSVEEVIKSGIMTGIGNNCFAPKDNLTIEQAICVVYRLYNVMPTGQKADGATISSDDETIIQTYENGITETKKNNMLLLKQGDQVLIEFETDIYSNIFCETIGDKIYAAAQNCYGKTDIYDVYSKSIVAKIPYPTYSVDSEYITAKSSVIGPFSFGLYDWYGSKVTDIVYSLSELSDLKNNNFKNDMPQYKEPSGMIYFSDWNDNGSLCSIDSNGENKFKLSDKNCVSSIYYLNGRLYYIADENNKISLYSIKPDGSGEMMINEYSDTSKVPFLIDTYNECYEITDKAYNGLLTRTVSDSEYDLNGKYYQIASDGNWIYYLSDNISSDKGFNSVYRFKITSDNTIEKEKVTDDVISNGRLIQFRNNKMYYINEKEQINNINEFNNYSSDLYCFDGSTTKKINGDIPVLDFCFYGNNIMIISGTSYDDVHIYICDENGDNLKIMDEAEQAKESYEQRVNNKNSSSSDVQNEISDFISEYAEMSDDKYKVYCKYTYDGESMNPIVHIADKSGNDIKVFNEHISLLKRYDNTIVYYKSNGLTNETELLSYNMDTGNENVISNNFYRAKTYTSDRFIFFYDINMNTWRYDHKNETVVEIAPNSDQNKYGYVADIFGENDGMYKIDTDGNYCLITNKEYAANCLYVENSTGRAIQF